MILGGKGLSKWYGANRAVNSVDFEVHAGEVVGLLGDNGAGKSTLIKLLSGAVQPTGGTVTVDGVPVAFASPGHARDAGVETIYQDLALAPNLSVAANMFLGYELRRRRWLVFRPLDEKRMEQEAAATIVQLKLKIPDIRLPVEALSGGQRQGVALARALHRQAATVIMDEPTGALGVAQQRRVLELIESLRERGVGVVFISHNIAQILRVSTRIVVLRHGEVVDERSAGDATEHGLVTAMVGGAT